MNARSTRLFVLGVAVAWIGGCVLESVDFADKSCPCAEGWRCDDTNTCVPASEGLCGRPGTEPGVVEVSNLRVRWTTPNQAGLEWDATNLEELFTYEVDVAADEEALAAGELLRTVDSDDNPELARGYLPNTIVRDDVLQTTLRALEPDMAYGVRLVAVDMAGNVSCSNIALARTTPPAIEGLPMAQEAPEGASPLPECVRFVESMDTASSGTGHWEYTVLCEEVDPDTGTPVCTEPVVPYPRCWENMRVQGLDYALELTESEFQQGFLEMSIEIIDTDNGFWGELGLTTRGEVGSDHFVRDQLTLASNVGYRLYQIPLSILTRTADRTPLTPELLARGVRGFRVGTIWRHGATVRIDDASIRW